MILSSLKGGLTFHFFIIPAIGYTNHILPIPAFPNSQNALLCYSVAKTYAETDQLCVCGLVHV